MDHLRSIALTVDENDPGQFTWLLMESQGDAIVFDVELDCAPEPVGSYAQALQAGYERLLSLAKDKATGPRGTGEDENADPVGETDVYGGNR